MNAITSAVGPSAITIRNAQIGDHGALTTLFRESNRAIKALRPDLFREVANPVPFLKFAAGVIARDRLGYEPVALMVAALDQKIVGGVYVETQKRSALSFSAFKKTAVIDNLVVLPEYRGRRFGVAQELGRAAIDWCRAHDVEYVTGKILVNNQHSLALAKLGDLQIDSHNVGLKLK